MVRYIRNSLLTIVAVSLVVGPARAQSSTPTPLATPGPGDLVFVGIFQTQPPQQETPPPEYLIAYQVPNSYNKYAGQAAEPTFNPDGTITYRLSGLVAGGVINLFRSLPPPSGVVCTLVSGPGDRNNSQNNQDPGTGLYHCATYDDPAHDAPPTGSVQGD